jgi:putative ABC transport system substrate-binding protein
MNRRRILLGLTALGMGVVIPARAQAPAKVPTVAIFTFGSRFNARTRTEAFLKAMRELGYEEGRNIRYESRFANGQPDLLRDLAQEIAREHVEVVVSASTLTTEALLQATSSVPIVMAAVEDPVISGFVKSLARPETNVTGLTSNAIDQVPRHMELLLKAVPGLGKAACLMNPTNAVYAAYRARVEWVAKSSRVRLAVSDATNYRDIERAFKALNEAPIGGLIVMSDSTFYTERNTITELAARFRIPAVYAQRAYVEAGGLISYGSNYEFNYTRAASYVDRILKGEKPGEMPIEEPANYELVVNRNAAKSLGLALSTDLLKRANKVIG